jgi:hypothetical protein
MPRRRCRVTGRSAPRQGPERPEELRVGVRAQLSVRREATSRGADQDEEPIAVRVVEEQREGRTEVGRACVDGSRRHMVQGVQGPNQPLDLRPGDLGPFARKTDHERGRCSGDQPGRDSGYRMTRQSPRQLPRAMLREGRDLRSARRAFQGHRRTTGPARARARHEKQRDQCVSCAHVDCDGGRRPPGSPRTALRSGSRSVAARRAPRQRSSQRAGART